MHTLMLVDDEKIVLEGLKIIISRILPECKIVATALDGEEGFHFGMELLPEIVITDIKMLKESGLSMIERLQEAGSTIRFIILSAYEDFQFAKQGMKLGVCNYLTKPVEEVELREAVRKIIAEIENSGEKKVDAFANEVETSEQYDIILKIRQYLENNYKEPIHLKFLAEKFNINMYYLSELFKEKTGQNFIDYLSGLRINKAKELLTITDMKVYEIGEALGYKDTTYFSKLFEKIAGCTPTAYRGKFRK